MQRIQNYIRIHEALDTENLYYKIDTFFKDGSEEKTDFQNLVSQYRESPIPPATIKDYYKNIDNVSFVDFMLDNIDKSQEGVDYDYVMTKILDSIIGDKSEKNPFNK